MAATIERLLAEARRRLAAAPHRPSSREASLLLARLLGLSEAQLWARSREPVPAGVARRFAALLERRLGGEPVAYLLGEKEFYGRPFAVDSRVLIPRPETEHLVAEVLKLGLPPAPRALDLGTGSGCLAVTLALEIAGCRVVASDLSPAALAVAAANVRRHGAGDRVALAATDLAAALRLGRFDLVVANPPYIEPAKAAVLSSEVRDFEPSEALFTPGPAGEFLARLLGSLEGLRPGTPALIEIGQGQSAAVRKAVGASSFALERIVPDYAGIPRVVVVRRQ